jgi:hypothetical protein
LAVCFSLSNAMAEETRFPRIAWTHNGPNESAFRAGELKAPARENGLDLSWHAPDEKEEQWYLSPKLFQDQVNGPEGDFDFCKESSLPCYGKCIRSTPQLQMYDSEEKVIYFSVVLDVGSNSPHAVFRADLAKREVVFLFDDFGSGLRGFALSPSNSMLAYLIGSHGSACVAGSYLKVFDLKSRGLIEPKENLISGTGPLRAYHAYDRLEWISDSQIELTGRTWNCDEPDGAEEIEIHAVAGVVAAKKSLKRLKSAPADR